MLIEETEKKRQAQLANTAPVVHAPPVVQPVVQPQAGYVPQGAVVGAYPPPPPAGQVYAPQPGYVPQGTVVQGGYAAQPGSYQPEGYKPEGY